MAAKDDGGGLVRAWEGDTAALWVVLYCQILILSRPIPAIINLLAYFIFSASQASLLWVLKPEGLGAGAVAWSAAERVGAK